jgi:hypothetical protein
MFWSYNKGTKRKEINDMQVYDNRKIKTVPFKSIAVGDTFFDSENENYAMRIVDCEDTDGCVNAVDLQTGRLLFYEDEEVEPIKGRIEFFA